MNMLSVFPVFLLGLVAAWLGWPLIADPIQRRRRAHAGAKTDIKREEFFRTLARRNGPKHDLFHVNRG